MGRKAALRLGPPLQHETVELILSSVSLLHGMLPLGVW